MKCNWGMLGAAEGGILKGKESESSIRASV